TPCVGRRAYVGHGGIATVKPIHPALHFDSLTDSASVGIAESPRSLVIVTRRGWRDLPTTAKAECHPKTGLWSGPQIEPEPLYVTALRGRWDAADLKAFCSDGLAPRFAEFLGCVRAELLRQIEFTRPETLSLIACWIAGTYFHPQFTAFPRLNFNGPKGSGK